MSTERRGIEVFVGLFLLVGFGFVAVMVVMFGRVGQGVKNFYQVTVEFPNASGLVKGSDVLLAGARIGHVAEAPKLVQSTFQVAVKLNIRHDVQIPRRTTFLVGSSGLLGDRFVEVTPTAGYDHADPLKPGEKVVGTRAGGFEDLTNKGGVVMDQLSEELQRIQTLTARLNEGLLHERNLKNLEETFANLKATTDSFKGTAQSLDIVVQKAGGTVDSAKATMETANSAAGDLKLAIGDFRKTADTATKAVDAARILVKKAGDGDGTLGALINDPKMADDLKALIANMRRSGVLFYKDRPVAGSAPATPAPRRR